ncbi:MAG: 16S rRNA (cytidine(1402)-2'-O)-methyltransferase [Burkholderiales bacterium]|jgi:16S rRNA (cytidine1402-2'-O)-methyltransferase|nr:16S rRNA (cytidine(1402)-2'-O)-methyltransferase [Burkholderiales bacterium]
MMSYRPHNSPLAENVAPVLERGAFTAAKRTLYVVATPLGNLRDLTLRALDVLRSADLILAEDTRVTAKLLSAYGISAPMRALHQHNEKSAVLFVIAALNEGKSLALVTDAGTPGISDPGAKLVNEVKNAGFLVAPIPGACAIAAAISGAGLLAEQFYFVGFLPSQKKARNEILMRLRGLECALVFYEAPHRVKETLAEFARVFEGDRDLIVARELTKTFETITRVPSAHISDFVDTHPETEKGEIVLILDAPFCDQHESTTPVLDDAVLRWLQALLEELPPARAAKVVAAATGIPRETIYQEAMRVQEIRGSGFGKK